ncbi:hypothetical protein CPJCM30710_22900 [Clostridium polyendosporum]|uniref:Uncharacterized protein n=1 Tax=Clostridium polyendosporum TaxID=69208 RepID=A0A919VEW7_9CLOT|nr:hypothetical protein [Clostridium polyendosporum]GIM29624.1 hypothetical protein CPJCM30710_22900 [Clostridium polyendosporum]
MITVGKIIKFVGELVAFSTENAIKGTGNITSKINNKLGRKLKGKQILILTDKTSNKVSNKILKITRNTSENCDKFLEKASLSVKVIKLKAFEKEVRIYGESKKFYDEECIVPAKFTVKE